VGNEVSYLITRFLDAKDMESENFSCYYTTAGGGLSRPSSEEEDYFLALNNNKRGNAINQIVKMVFSLF